jgi:hypothetical protein
MFTADNAFVKSAWLADDIITLFALVALLITATYLSNKGSEQWLMVWIGLMGYVFYNFAFYLFGAAFNIFSFCMQHCFHYQPLQLLTVVINLHTPWFYAWAPPCWLIQKLMASGTL